MLGIKKKSVLLAMCVAIVLFITFKAEDNETNNVDDIEKLETDKSENPQPAKKLPEVGVVGVKKCRTGALIEVAVVGVKKCWTGALIEVLRMHPGIVAPPYHKTEILFWGQQELMERGLDYYKVQKIIWFEQSPTLSSVR
jgi:hypothetical protein